MFPDKLHAFMEVVVVSGPWTSEKVVTPAVLVLAVKDAGGTVIEYVNEVAVEVTEATLLVVEEAGSMVGVTMFKL